MAFYLEPEVSAANASASKVDTGNEAARQFIPAEILDDPVIFPGEDVLGRSVFTEDVGDDERLFVEAWERVQQA